VAKPQPEQMNRGLRGLRGLLGYSSLSALSAKSAVKILVACDLLAVSKQVRPLRCGEKQAVGQTGAITWRVKTIPFPATDEYVRP
jgi:hypothetical protein